MNLTQLVWIMDIISLKLNNVFSYENLYINFQDTDFSLFIGKTGSGKTAIFDGLLWTLYDRTARKSYSKIKVVRDVPIKQKECFGEIIILSDDGLEYTIKRKYIMNVLKLELYQNGDNISQRTPTLVQEQINDIEIGRAHV